MKAEVRYAEVFFIKRSPVWDYILMLVGTALIAVSIQCVYDPVSMVTGGFTGLAIIIKDVTGYLIPGGIPLWLTNLVLNVPLFGSFKDQRKTFLYGERSLEHCYFLSGSIYCPLVDLTDGDYVLAAIFGGCIGGVGMGLVLLAKSTTGGTEMIATLIQHYYKHYSVVRIIQFFRWCSRSCRIICIWCTRSIVCDRCDLCDEQGIRCTDGRLGEISKAAFIITDHYEQVATHLMTELDGGITGLGARAFVSG